LPHRFISDPKNKNVPARRRRRSVEVVACGIGNWALTRQTQRNKSTKLKESLLQKSFKIPVDHCQTTYQAETERKTMFVAPYTK
jgi:hypothetical protein